MRKTALTLPKFKEITLCLILALSCSCAVSSGGNPLPWSLHYQSQSTLTPPEEQTLREGWKIASKLRKKYGLNTCPAPLISILTTQEIRSITKLHIKSEAIYSQGNIFIDRGILRDKDRLQRTLGHELVHAYHDCLSSGKIPVWLDEGLAQSMFDATSIVPQNQTLLPMNILKNGILQYSPQDTKRAYQQSLSMTRYLLKITSWKSILRYLQLLQTNQARAFEQAFAISERDFYRNFLHGYRYQASNRLNKN